MSRPTSAKKPQTKRRTTLTRAKTTRSRRVKKGGRKKVKDLQNSLLKNLLFISLEGLGLAIIGLAAIILLVGFIGNRFSGTGFVQNLLPFAGGILALIFLASLLLSAWKRLRRLLQARNPLLPPTVILCLTLLICVVIPREDFTRAYGYYRTLVGGKEEAGRVALAHQVYAAYRRLNIVALSKMISRANPYEKVIDEAASAYAIDTDLLMGLAAAESSYLPRKSEDGGHGLFQITQAPASVLTDVNSLFQPADRQMNDPRYNAFLGAATLRYYLSEMHDDLFLGLLAYNIGPANGGLQFIMQQYGVTDFSTIQPYLLQLPRDYPVRVLAYALAFRIERKKGTLLAYEEGKNAMTIQALGIPGQ